VSDSVFSFAPELMNWDAAGEPRDPNAMGDEHGEHDVDLFNLFINSDALASEDGNFAVDGTSPHQEDSLGAAPNGLPHVASDGNIDALGNVSPHQGLQDPDEIDPKKAKRILANRQSAQRSRMRKLQYVSDLETTVKRLQEQVSALTPHIQDLRDRKTQLDAQNGELRARVGQLVCDSAQRDSLNNALRQEVARLQMTHHHAVAGTGY